MGTWGFNILSDDTARDVYADYMKHFNAGRSAEEIERRVTKKWKGCLNDPDEGPIVVLAGTKAKWDCGHLDKAQIAEVRRIVKQGLGLDTWREAGPKALASRKMTLVKFLKAIQKRNPNPKKPKPAIKRRPIFKPGDCLSIRLSDGDFGAALVLRDPPASKDPADETYGTNLIGQLNYKAKKRPGIEVFEKRRWFTAKYGFGPTITWKGRESRRITNVAAFRFRGSAECFEVVGNIALRKTDPREASMYSGWDFAEDIVRQSRWDRGFREEFR